MYYQTTSSYQIFHIQWGDLNPEIVGDVQWSLKESNSVYTSILAKYQVRCQDDKEETARYNVKEFFRIRSVGDTIYLLDYNRDLQEVSGAVKCDGSRGYPAWNRAGRCAL